MKRIKIVSVVLLLGILLASFMTATAQEVQVKRAEKIVTVGSKQFYMHHVKAGETLYAIAKAYHVTEDQITDCNPDLKNNGLRAGSVLGIPAVVFDDEPEPEAPKPAETPHVVEKQTSQVVTVGSKKFYMHHVKQGETIYGIAKAYEVTEQALRDLNPELSEGLKTGMVIGVPVLAGQPKVEPKQEPKVEPKQEPKVEPKQEPKVEPKQEPKVEPKQEPKVEPKQEPKVEPKQEPKVEPKQEPKVEPKQEPKVEPKQEPKVEPKQEPKVEPKQEPKVIKEEIPAVTHRDTVVEIGGKHYVMHYVNPGETVWGLTQAYQVTEQELLAKNPEIADGLKAGMVIGIPVVEATPKEEPKVTPATPKEEPKVTPKEEPQEETLNPKLISFSCYY